MNKGLSSFAILMLTAGCGNVPVKAPTFTPWTDEAKLYTVDLPAPPTPRDVQELNGVGTINYKVYGVQAEPYVFRVAALVYPGLVPGLTSFHPKEELAHASGKKVARMQGQVEHDEAVDFDAAHFVGNDLMFTVSEEGHTGHGILRTLLTTTAPAVRYEALCLAPGDADLEVCRTFVKSLRPCGPSGAHCP